MDRGVKYFVGKILAIHLALLILLLTVVTFAAKRVHQSALDQAIEHATALQTLLANQTAHGIEGFYESILGDLRLLKPEEEPGTDLPNQPVPMQAEPRQVVNLGIVGRALGKQLALQLEGRAYPFIVDDRMHPHTLGAEERPPRALIDNRIGRKPFPPATAPANPFEGELITRFGPWLRQIQEPEISRLELIDGRAIKLVSIPLFGMPRYLLGDPQPVAARAGWLVAAVSAHNIEADFLSILSNRHKISGAFLVDDSMTIMAASNHQLVGTHVDANTAPDILQTLADFKTQGYNATAVVYHSFHVGSQTFEPSLVTASPVNVKGYPWFALIALPLKEVDGGVDDLSRKALVGAIVVAVAVAGILVSTAAQLIMTRLRMERVRHETLQNEMRQARQIQLAWLPQKTKTTTSDGMLDIASLNRPATHISGDFYNFFELPDGRTAVLIGDVTGHGMAAAFLMATTQLLLRNTLPQHCDPGEALELVNQQLTNQVFNGQFVTMQILVIEPSTGEVLIATAGHPAPLLCMNGKVHSLQLESQLVAGLDHHTKYPTERFHLQPGASLLLYTDGVVEIDNPAGEMLRLDGLIRALTGDTDTAEELLQRSISAVNTHRRGRELHDDLTIVAVRLALNLEGSNRPSPLHEGLTESVHILGRSV